MSFRNNLLDTSSPFFSERHRPLLVAETVPLSDADARRLERTMRKMFALRASDCVGYAPSETQLDPNFRYPAWLTRTMY